MYKSLILTLILVSSAALAQSAVEEAIILNQELQFLEDSVQNIEAVTINTTDVDASRDRAINDESLERTYFGETEEDTIKTRTSGPKRRSY